MRWYSTLEAIIPGTMPSVSGASNKVLIVTLWTFTLLENKQNSICSNNTHEITPRAWSSLMLMHLQYTGCMLQAGEFKNVKFEITISSEYRNSTRWGRLWFSSWERSQFHHTEPWPSISPLFPTTSGPSTQQLSKLEKQMWHSQVRTYNKKITSNNNIR